MLNEVRLTIQPHAPMTDTEVEREETLLDRPAYGVDQTYDATGYGIGAVDHESLRNLAPGAPMTTIEVEESLAAARLRAARSLARRAGALMAQAGIRHAEDQAERQMAEQQAEGRRRMGTDVAADTPAEAWDGYQLGEHRPEVAPDHRATFHPEAKRYIVIGPIGSRHAFLTVSWLPGWEDGRPLHITTGCFSGGLDEFENQCHVKHGSRRAGRDYAAAIQFIRTLDQLQRLILD